MEVEGLKEEVEGLEEEVEGLTVSRPLMGNMTPPNHKGGRGCHMLEGMKILFD